MTADDDRPTGLPATPTTVQAIQGLLADALIDDPQAAAQRVLHHYVDNTDPDGVPAGSFVQALVAAFAAADTGNRSRLHRGFPAYGYAFLVLDGHVDGRDLDAGLARLHRLARGEE